MPACFLAITSREEDLEFAKNLVKDHASIQFQVAESVKRAEQILIDNPLTLVFWDADHPKSEDKNHPMSAAAVMQMLRRSTQPDRVFAVTDKPLRQLRYLFGAAAFNHHLLRRYSETASTVYSQLVLACLKTDPFGVDNYVPEGTSIRSILLKRSSHRPKAVEAIQNILAKRGVHPKLISMMVQACDELMMNAIFSAPIDKGVRYRAEGDRTEDFELGAKEEVKVTLASAPGYTVFSVTDHFGSIDKHRIVSFLQKDYENTHYKPLENEPSAGLGLYGIVRSGQSLVFLSKPGQKTEVMLLLPVSKTPKEFREGFSLFSFISQ